MQKVAQVYESVWTQEKQAPYSSVNLNILSGRTAIAIDAGSALDAVVRHPPVWLRLRCLRILLDYVSFGG